MQIAQLKEIVFSLSFVYLAFALNVQLASAQAQPKNCDVGVKVLSGSERKAGASKEDLQMNSFLGDTSAYLEPLPFSRYRALGEDKKTLSFEQKGEFHVVTENKEQHSLSVVPHALAAGKVHMTVHWRGPGGERLLSTKLRVNNGEQMVVGTDSTGDSSTILSIKVDCK